MSSLREALAKMKGAPIRCVETDCRPVAVVTFYPWQAKEWALPWSRLDAMSVCDEEESERVELFFPHHHIIMIGDPLRADGSARRSLPLDRGDEPVPRSMGKHRGRRPDPWDDEGTGARAFRTVGAYSGGTE